MTPAPIVLLIFSLFVGIIYLINKERRENLNEAFNAELRVLKLEYDKQNEPIPDKFRQADIDFLLAMWQDTVKSEKQEAAWMLGIMAFISMPAAYLLFALIFMTH